MLVEQARLAIFNNLFRSVADEMGVTVERTAYSPNIKERLDFSCALFTTEGEMVAQAAHIPVHLGAMPLSVKAALDRFPSFAPGDIIMLNDPYMGGTHLPDITLITPLFAGDELIGFAACRAHHNDVGGVSAGSMPVAKDIFQEGIRIPPVRLYDAGKLNSALLDLILANVRVPRERRADLYAQVAALRRAQIRAEEIVAKYGVAAVRTQMRELLDYTERLMRERIRRIPDGRYTFTDVIEDDGCGNTDLPIRVAVEVRGDEATVDFAGSAPQAEGPVNAVYAVTLSAVVYCFRCLLGPETPASGGSFRPLTVLAPEGTVVNASFPAPVAAGNVETSQRIVDVVLGALAQALADEIPAAACGTMNNLAMGGFDADGNAFAYYETMGGGMGAHAGGDGLSAVQTHMTNTKNTPVEALELAYPLRVVRYDIRRGSGGAGRYSGGDGLVREIEVLQPCDATLLTERRRTAPYGLVGGSPGRPGRNLLSRGGGPWQELDSKVQLRLEPGDRLRIETPGGGGYGVPAQ